MARHPTLATVRHMIADAIGLDRSTALKTIDYMQKAGLLPKGGGGRGGVHAATVTPEQVALMLPALGWAELTRSPMRGAEAAKLFSDAVFSDVLDEYHKEVEDEGGRRHLLRWSAPRSGWPGLTFGAAFGGFLAAKLRHWSEAKCPESLDVVRVLFQQKDDVFNGGLVFGRYEDGRFEPSRPRPNESGVVHESAILLFTEHADAKLRPYAAADQRLLIQSPLIWQLARLYTADARAPKSDQGKNATGRSRPPEPRSRNDIEAAA